MTAPRDRPARRVAGQGVRHAQRAPGRLLRGGAGRARRSHRAERRGQDDAAADPRGRARADVRAPSRSTVARSAGCRSSRRSTRKLSVAENLRLFARLEKVADVDATVGRMLDQTGLRDRADDPVGTLSGGNQQRVNIAVGLLGEPRLLLLDEPSSSLDPRQRERLWEFVATLAREDATTVVYTTHNVVEAERHADRVLVLADGELLFTGTPAELEQRDRASTRRSTSRARSCASCGSAATDALAAAQGPADPAALAAARGAARALSAARRAARRRRAVVGTVEAEGRVREPRAARRGADQPRRPAARRDHLRRAAVRERRARSGSTRARRRSRRSSRARRSARS